MRTLAISLSLCLGLVAGCTEEAHEPTASCDDPAPLEGAADPRAPAYLVTLRTGVDAAKEQARIDKTYGLSSQLVIERTLIFSSLTDEQRDLLRCDPAVAVVAHDAVATPL